MVVPDLAKAAEIRYGKIPLTEKELETATKRLKRLQVSRSILKEEIMQKQVVEIIQPLSIINGVI